MIIQAKDIVKINSKMFIIKDPTELFCIAIDENGYEFALEYKNLILINSICNEINEVDKIFS